MIKVINCKNKNYLEKLRLFLEKRKYAKSKNIKIVTRIIEDVKKNKIKALLKYEKNSAKIKKLD